MSKPSFFAELKRRQIYRGGVMYVVAGWVMVQVATQVFPFFDIPVWAIRLVVVLIMLGFPLSLVALWMFESAQPGEPQPLERRQARDASAELARVMAAERLERQRENGEMIAALAQLRQAPGTVAESSPVVAAPQTVVAAPPVPLAAPVHPQPQRRSLTPKLLGVLAILILLSGLWALVSEPVAVQEQMSVSGHLAKRYVVPGFHQVETIGVGLLAPLLEKFGIGIAPERVFTGLLVLVALLVLRNLFRGFARARSRRRVQRQSAPDGASHA
jgi:protein-S-isoprenylcysteine O-methyltransferase Ste14